MQKYLRVLGRGLAGADVPPAAIRKGALADGGVRAVVQSSADRFLTIFSFPACQSGSLYNDWMTKMSPPRVFHGMHCLFAIFEVCARSTANRGLFRLSLINSRSGPRLMNRKMTQEPVAGELCLFKQVRHSRNDLQAMFNRLLSRGLLIALKNDFVFSAHD
jgi:hypothetical protein